MYFLKSKINNEKDESIDLLKANTSRLNEIVDIMQESKKLDKYLQSKQKNLVCFFRRVKIEYFLQKIKCLINYREKSLVV